MIRGLDFESGGLGFNPQSKKNAEHQFSLNIDEWILERKKFGVRTTCELQVSLITGYPTEDRTSFLPSAYFHCNIFFYVFCTRLNFFTKIVYLVIANFIIFLLQCFLDSALYQVLHGTNIMYNIR